MWPAQDIKVGGVHQAYVRAVLSGIYHPKMMVMMMVHANNHSSSNNNQGPEILRYKSLIKILYQVASNRPPSWYPSCESDMSEIQVHWGRYSRGWSCHMPLLILDPILDASSMGAEDGIPD